MRLPVYLQLLICICAAPVFAFSQTPGFMHIQSENNRSYVVQCNGNSFLSSETGYLVIPQLSGGTYTLQFSFQDLSLPDYRFSVTLGDKPRGFSLKQAINNSWSLFDMVSFDLINGEEVQKPKEIKPETVLPVRSELPPVSSEPKVAAAKVSEHVVKNTGTEKALNPKIKSSRPSGIQKIFDKAGLTGIDEVYIIQNKDRADTVAIFIPFLKEEQPGQTARQTYPSRPFLISHTSFQVKKMMNLLTVASTIN